MAKILIVDDEKDVVWIMERCLSTTHEITSSCSPAQALDLFQKKGFDLVITDLQMPEMSGIELIKQIKGINPAQKFMVMTANPYNDQVPLVKSQNITLIEKPFSIKVMRATVDAELF